MLTTVIYRSHLCADIPYNVLEKMVAEANRKNGDLSITGILLFNGTHLFQLLEGPEEEVLSIYNAICCDERHHNIVELLRDYAPSRRFGNYGMELFDIRQHERDEVLQNVLDKGTTRYQLRYQDRALQFFRTFVESREKETYFELPSPDDWEFVKNSSELTVTVPDPFPDEPYSFAFQPIIDPLAREVVSMEALLRTKPGASPLAYFEELQGHDIYVADLKSKKLAFARAGHLDLGSMTLSVNLFPMTLVNVPGAVEFLLTHITSNNLVPEQIIVEFTELEVISRLDEFTGAVRQLKAAGISIAIDDFGAGFAGLKLLSLFQPDRIKITRELIGNIHKNGARQAIIHGLLHACQSLEIQVTAVGIEHVEEWMWLESAGIEHFQGFLFARPELDCFPSVAWPEKKSDF